MNYMASTRKKRRNKQNKIVIGIIIALGLVISIYLLSKINIPFVSNLSSKLTYGIDSIFSSISGVVTEGTSYFGNTKKLNEANKELERKLNEANTSLNELEVLKVKNKDLQELLKIEERYSHFEKVYANVITRSYNNWNETFVIDKGTKDGICENQTVIAEGGLVGYVSEAHEKTSTIVTILDVTSSISVEISNINALALAKGDYSLKDNSKIKLVNIPIDVEISTKETIYTSGIGGLYKKGIPIGEVTDIVNKKNNIDRYAVVKTFVDFPNLDMVAVVIK